MRRFFALLACSLMTACLALTTADGPWPCKGDDDCEDGLVCRVRTGASTKLCVSPSSCQSTNDCAGRNTTCVNGACTESCEGGVCPSPAH